MHDKPRPTQHNSIGGATPAPNETSADLASVVRAGEDTPTRLGALVHAFRTSRQWAPTGHGTGPEQRAREKEREQERERESQTEIRDKETQKHKRNHPEVSSNAEAVSDSQREHALTFHMRVQSHCDARWHTKLAQDANTSKHTHRQTHTYTHIHALRAGREKREGSSTHAPDCSSTGLASGAVRCSRRWAQRAPSNAVSTP